MFWLLNDYSDFLIKRLLVPHNTRSQMEGITFSCKVNWVLNLPTYHLGSVAAPRAWMVHCTTTHGLHREPGSANRGSHCPAIWVSELATTIEPFLLKVSSPTCECLKFKFPVNHKQAVSKIHNSPGCVVWVRKIRTKFSRRKKENLSKKYTIFFRISWHVAKFLILRRFKLPYLSKLLLFFFFSFTVACEPVKIWAVPISCTADYQCLYLADSVAVEPSTYDKENFFLLSFSLLGFLKFPFLLLFLFSMFCFQVHFFPVLRAFLTFSPAFQFPHFPFPPSSHTT